MTSRTGRTLAWVAVTLATVLAAIPAAAQAPVRRNLLSINPLGIPFEYFSGEYERNVSGLTTFGLQASYLNIDDGSYSTVEAKVRFYPNEEAPTGFSLGLATGITRVSEDRYNGTSSENVSETRPTIAVIVDYNWVLGKAKRVIVGGGVGAKRLIGSSGDFLDIETAYPTARFQIGVRY